jgi:hypothetical protein
MSVPLTGRTVVRVCDSPFELWIGVGIGEITEPYRKPVNLFAGVKRLSGLGRR